MNGERRRGKIGGLSASENAIYTERDHLSKYTQVDESTGERARRQNFRHRLSALRRHAKRRDTRHIREQSLVGIFFSKKVPILMTFSRNVSLKPVLRRAPRYFSRVQQDSRSRPSIGWVLVKTSVSV